MTKFFKKYKKIILLLAVVATFGLVRMALAAEGCAKGDIVLQVWMPGVGWCVKGFPEYLQAIYNLFVGISMIMFGGFQWLIAGGNPTKISGAKTQILSAMAGLTLLLASYTILNVINPELTTLGLTNPAELAGRDYTGFASAANYCPTEGISDGYVDTKGGGVAVSADQTVCGHDYSVKSGAETFYCSGKKCEGLGRYCYQRVCVEGQWMGAISCASTNKKCVDDVQLKLLCEINEGKDQYEIIEMGGMGFGSGGTEERASEYVLSNVNRTLTICEIHHQAQKGKTMGLYVQVEVKSESDVWRGLKSIGSGNSWTGSDALGGLFNKEPDDYTKEEWKMIIDNKELMPVDVLKDEFIPVVYNINVGDTLRYKNPD